MAVVVITLYAVYCSGCPCSLTPHCWIIRAGKGIVFGANILNLMAITFDRHTAFFNPLRYSAKMTKRKMTLALSAVWGIPFLATAARNIWQHGPPQQALQVDTTYNVVLVFGFFFIPLFFLLLMNLRILYIIQQQTKQIQAVCNDKTSLSVQTRQNDVRNARKLRGTLACVAVVLVYIICWFPRIFYNFCALFRRPDLVRPTLVQLSLFFLFLQSSLNPFIYSFYRVEFRQAAYRLIRCHRQELRYLGSHHSKAKFKKRKYGHRVTQSVIPLFTALKPYRKEKRNNMECLNRL